jgi:hypothetical protein
MATHRYITESLVSKEKAGRLEIGVGDTVLLQWDGFYITPALVDDLDWEDLGHLLAGRIGILVNRAYEQGVADGRDT